LARPLPASKIFVQDISIRLHYNLVIKASHKKVLSAATSTQSNRKVHPARDVDIFNALQWKSGLLRSRPQQTSDLPTVSAETNTLDDAIFVKGTKEKKHILDAYKEHFGQNFYHWIVSKKKSKIELDPTLDYPCMKPALDKWYHVSELLILNVITMMITEHHLSFHDLK
jgi:hypothetical protein